MNSKKLMRGFTLVEVIVVIAIIAVVAMIATPSILSIINTSKNSSYEMMIDNIRTSAQEMYQEIDYMGSDIYIFNNNGRTTNTLSISSNSVVVNLQTLVGNGFLSGSTNSSFDEEKCNNGDASLNCNKKVILEPSDNEDIGICEIKITKIKGSNSKVCYKIEGISSTEICPTTLDFGGDNQCTS